MITGHWKKKETNGFRSKRFWHSRRCRIRKDNLFWSGPIVDLDFLGPIQWRHHWHGYPLRPGFWCLCWLRSPLGRLRWVWEVVRVLGLIKGFFCKRKRKTKVHTRMRTCRSGAEDENMSSRWRLKSFYAMNRTSCRFCQSSLDIR